MSTEAPQTGNGGDWIAPKVGDGAILYPAGCLPSRVSVTGVTDGKITSVRLIRTRWLTAGPDEFTIEGEAPADRRDCLVLFDPFQATEG